MTPERLKQVVGDDNLIARMRPWNYGVLITAIAILIAVFRNLGEL